MEETKTDKPKTSNQIKVIIVGTTGVGKTCLLARYTTGRFLQELPSTCGSSYIQKKIIINNKKYLLNLWDTAGQEKYDSLTKIFTKNANVIILVYSITDKSSFLALDKWLNLVREINNDDFVLGIAANKSDLYLRAQVKDKQGKDYAKKVGAVWRSTSAFEDDKGIDELLNELVTMYIKQDLLSNRKTNSNFKLTKNDPSKEKGEGGCCGGKNGNSGNGNNTKGEGESGEDDNDGEFGKKGTLDKDDDEDF